MAGGLLAAKRFTAVPALGTDRNPTVGAIQTDTETDKASCTCLCLCKRREHITNMAVGCG